MNFSLHTRICSKWLYRRAVYSVSQQYLQPDNSALTVRRCQEVIRRVAGELVQEKKHKLMESNKTGSSHNGKDLLSLLCQLVSLRCFV